MAACVAREEIEKAFVAARRDLAFAMATLVRDARTDLDRTRKRLGQSTERVVVRNRSTIGTAAARLNALSPLATLSRGYAVARDPEGGALTSVRHFKPGSDFELLLHDGKVNAETRSVE